MKDERITELLKLLQQVKEISFDLKIEYSDSPMWYALDRVWESSTVHVVNIKQYIDREEWI